jgi:hypothetical protein
VLDIFKGNLTMDIESVIHAVNNDLVVIPREMPSQLHVPVNSPTKISFKITVL